jgi:hypothetical protein
LTIGDGFWRSGSLLELIALFSTLDMRGGRNVEKIAWIRKSYKLIKPAPFNPTRGCSGRLRALVASSVSWPDVNHDRHMSGDQNGIPPSDSASDIGTVLKSPPLFGCPATPGSNGNQIQYPGESESCPSGSDRPKQQSLDDIEADADNSIASCSTDDACDAVAHTRFYNMPSLTSGSIHLCNGNDYAQQSIPSSGYENEDEDATFGDSDCEVSPIEFPSEPSAESPSSSFDQDTESPSERYHPTLAVISESGEPSPEDDRARTL